LSRRDRHVPSSSSPFFPPHPRGFYFTLTYTQHKTPNLLRHFFTTSKFHPKTQSLTFTITITITNFTPKSLSQTFFCNTIPQRNNSHSHTHTQSKQLTQPCICRRSRVQSTSTRRKARATWWSRWSPTATCRRRRRTTRRRWSSARAAERTPRWRSRRPRNGRRRGCRTRRAPSLASAARWTRSSIPRSPTSTSGSRYRRRWGRRVSIALPPCAPISGATS